ncbi:hypothetical protein L596_000860 [Steinernema carpocapsae]|uniref:Uncharacterized protein n=1 Tax=Steinernema carpocapsae TaxID=34508 RepID=A0A4U8UJN5_STECR|nr:hypothetical protein L596_000860 [Steinernema carpocapsae]
MLQGMAIPTVRSAHEPLKANLQMAMVSKSIEQMVIILHNEPSSSKSWMQVRAQQLNRAATEKLVRAVNNGEGLKHWRPQSRPLE